MSKLKLYVFALFLVFSLVFSKKIKFEDNWGSQGFNLSKSATSGVSITYSVNEFSMTENLINNEMKTTVQLSGVFLPNDEGAPDLPGSARYIAIPQGATAKYVITDMKKEVYQNIDLAPAPNIPIDTDSSPIRYEENSLIYSTNAYYPESPVILSKPSKIRGLDVVLLGITPFQYNPVTKELIVFRDIKVDVQYEGGNGHFGEDRLRNSEWDKILKNTVINNSVIEDVEYQHSSSSKGIDYEYIIICPDNPTFISYANQLKDFRTKQGIRTGVVTITEVGGNTEAAIENYINTAYNTWTIPPSAVLLLADYGLEGTSDAIFCPRFMDTYYPMVSDNFYADVDTSDGKALPEIVFGRIVAQNEAQLQVMISKIINYETNPPTSSSFYANPITALGWQTERWFQICSEALGGFMKNELGKTPVRINEVYEGNPTSDPWSSALNTSQVTDYFGPSGRGYIPSTPQELGFWTGGDANDIANALNDGAFILVHRDHGITYGWGEPAFTTTNIGMLTNTDLSFIFSMNCQTGMFDDGSEVFSERFHRYTYNGENAGALGVIAATHNSYSFVNDALAWGTFDYIYPQFMPDYGPSPSNNDEFMPAFAMVNGKYFLDYSSWPSNPTEKEETNYLFHMLGDPYQVVYSEVPQYLTVNTQEIFEGETVLYVTADIGAKIALVANGEILGTGIGTGGVTGITIPPQLFETEIILTVTKQNYFRYETIIEVGVPLTDIGGDFSVDNPSIDYGYTTVGASTDQQFTITNSHSIDYLIGDITTIPGYSVNYAVKDIKNTLHYTIPPSSSRTFDLIFEPTAEVVYNGNITITSSDTAHATEYISVTGEGALPDINLPLNTSATAEPDANVADSFEIQNTGLSALSYSLSNAYVGFLIQGGAYTTNDFSSFPGTGWTNSGWVESSGAARATGSGATSTLTSPAFDTSGAGNPVYLEFTQNYYARTGSWTKVEYYTGSAWVEVYNVTSSTTSAQNIELPIKSATTQVRFTGYTTRSQGMTAYWDIDNIVVSSEEVPFNWLSFNSSTTGLVSGSGSDTINMTYDATGLPEGVYQANITVTSDDPDEPAEVVAVQFNVIIGGPVVPSVPENIVTSITGTDLVIDWDVSANATGYDVYSSDDPYGTYTLAASVVTNQYTVPADQAKLFYYIVAKN
ncbi:MAG: hypothetical protein JXR69_07985 [Candidatus Delongbacteria bacterium]|nr:hypothetical protein [Candidatus Delongbacteria bacterium]